MSRPKKPAKTRKNRLPEFREAIVAKMPAQLSRVASGANKPRFGAVGWAVGTILAGILIGRLYSILGSGTSLVPGPNPVATASLSVNQTSLTGNLSVDTTPPLSSLSVTGSSSITQAQVGAPYETATTNYFQSATGPSALEPWVTDPGQLQGTLGTSAVEQTQ